MYFTPNTTQRIDPHTVFKYSHMSANARKNLFSCLPQHHTGAKGCGAFLHFIYSSFQSNFQLIQEKNMSSIRINFKSARLFLITNYYYSHYIKCMIPETNQSYQLKYIIKKF